MKEITTVKYFCDFCKRDFDNSDDCWKCECSHSLEDRLNLVKNSIVCPVCNGEGYVDGVDGYDILTCYTCHGKKIVVPKKVTTLTYITEWN